jgi:hypothetical protein
MEITQSIPFSYGGNSQLEQVQIYEISNIHMSILLKNF